jgi:hypothetical protein
VSNCSAAPRRPAALMLGLALFLERPVERLGRY